MERTTLDPGVRRAEAEADRAAAGKRPRTSERRIPLMGNGASRFNLDRGRRGSPRRWSSRCWCSASGSSTIGRLRCRSRRCRRRPRSPIGALEQRSLLAGKHLDDGRGDPDRLPGLATLLGVLLAMLIRSSRTIERALYPWLVVSQMSAGSGGCADFVIWTGFDMRPKVMVIALVVLLPDRRQHDRRPAGRRPGAAAADADLEGLALAALPLGADPGVAAVRVQRAQGGGRALGVGAVFGEWVGASEGSGT